MIQYFEAFSESGLIRRQEKEAGNEVIRHLKKESSMLKFLTLFAKNNKQAKMVCERLCQLPAKGFEFGSGLEDAKLRVGKLLTHRPSFNFPNIEVRFEEMVIVGKLKNIEAFGLTQS